VVRVNTLVYAISVMLPAPIVLPPSRIANLCPDSIAIDF